MPRFGGDVEGRPLAEQSEVVGDAEREHVDNADCCNSADCVFDLLLVHAMVSCRVSVSHSMALRWLRMRGAMIVRASLWRLMIGL